MTGDTPLRRVALHGERHRLFHRYLAAHSLLIGLLPFFVPVYLWELGLPLGGLCLLIGVSGLAFSAALGVWQRMARTRSLATLIGATFAFELVLVAVVVLAGSLLGEAPDGMPGGPSDRAAWLLVACLVGVANGVYNAFYWTTQRALFIALGTERDSGRRYGNLQIIVAGFLKAGILAGGLLIDAGALPWILLLSALIGSIGTWTLAADAGRAPLHTEPPVTLRRALGYRDAHGSRRPFVIDGLFLYLESHFWTLSLFLLAREDHSTLGLVVIMLGIAFALLFLLIKNRIDRTGAADAVYRVSVALYAGSWLLRLAVDPEAPPGLTLALLVCITFCSSLFRLAFNKRFFDIARSGTHEDIGAPEHVDTPPTTSPRTDDGIGMTTGPPTSPLSGSPIGRSGGPPDGPGEPTGPVDYLVIKSHLSQLGMALVFLPLAAATHLSAAPLDSLLTLSYALAAVLAMGYFGYRRAPASGAAEGR